MRRYRSTHEPSAADRFKMNARSQANVYERRGKIIRKPCEVCGSEDSEKHLPDYSRPRWVRWLCREHHLALHRRRTKRKHSAL